VPWVIETSVGVDRTMLAVLVDAYHEEEVKGETRVVMKFSPKLAPFHVAVFPLSDKISEPARKLELSLRKSFIADFDGAGSIGKRYRRHDEIGTPFCVTYDFQSEEDKAVTVRDRDSMAQERIAVDKVAEYLKTRLSS
jgi:glycyl-tRNA synthetase